MTAPAKHLPSPSPVTIVPVPVPAEVMKRLRENQGPSYCPSCGEGEHETTDGRESRREMCRWCDQAEDIRKLRKQVDDLESRLRGMEAYHG